MSFNFSLYEDVEEEAPYAQKQKKQPVDESKFNFSLYETEKEPEEKQFSNIEILKDVGKQSAKEFLIGSGGSWGDLASLAGLPQGQTPGSKASNSLEYQILDKMEQPGYEPSFSDFQALSSDDELAPKAFNFPSSDSLRDLNESLGGPGQAETPAGRFAGRAFNRVGAGAAFGQLNPIPGIVSGIAGQGVEEVGGGPLLQAGAEIASILLTGKGSGKGLADSSKREVRDKVNQLRRLGYSDEEITLAINSSSKGKVGGLKASKGQKTEQAFEDFAEHSNDMVSNILTSEIPGIDRGISNVHQMASDAYGQVAREASQLNIPISTPFINSATSVVRDLRRTLGRNPEAEAFINRLHDAVQDSVRNPTAENYINFYKELNKAGKWMGRSEKDRLLTQLKNGIKDTFRSEGPQGRELARKFEEVNVGIKRAFDAEEVHDLIQKTATQDGIDFKKLYKVFDKPDNVHLLEEVLGNTQTRNLNQIAKVGREVKDFDKAWKNTSLITGTPLSLAGNAAYLIYSGNWAALAGIKGAEAAGRVLSEQALTNPKFQNILIRGIHAIKNESPRALLSANKALEKYLEQQDINLSQKDGRPKD